MNAKKARIKMKWAVKVRHFYGFYYVQIKQKTKT
ncbi:hypothetical protein DBQ04_00005 [Lactobacillus acidophilus]|uniref:Uncharacterized protein n=1 Tax=Lactobacillus acidophilus (strain ATCC 700396 / NCK56 / N2 / NCFM) TaxID=272621 RepID=Q5FJJ6_LACAC|nr:hypothetical protein LBA1298 [Lactobacillus acidophilus NCFM]KAB1967052.1 hypothetical protein F8247_03330 [Lactobacillus acidophilus]MBO8211470.1 hypothetical protein [Lactobacillus acidophilus]MCT3604096.1 hypothetical protein [Lactobacillus acidophilus]MCT3608621.1 hypothetical protein [Lactobacillus acidophilus]